LIHPILFFKLIKKIVSLKPFDDTSIDSGGMYHMK